MDSRIKTLIQELIDALKEKGLLEVVDSITLFGSRARGDAEERSDIDIAVLCPKATKSEWLAIVDVIEDLPTLLKFDVVRFEEASEPLQQRVQQEGMIIYEQTED